MRRIIPATLAVLLLVGTAAAVPAAGYTGAAATGASGTDAVAQSANETSANETVAPGERLSGVVGTQEAELEGEVESRAFGLSVARAANDEARAALIAAEVNETREEVRDLRERREALREARANGSMSRGEYAARMAELAARNRNVERIANDSANASRDLPTELLESKGINATAIERLRTDAANLTGPEVAAIARDIAGDGEARARGAAGDRGEADDAADRRGDGATSTGAEDGRAGDATTADGTGDGTTVTDGERTTSPGPDERGPGDGRDADGGSDAGSDRGGPAGGR